MPGLKRAIDSEIERISAKQVRDAMRSLRGTVTTLRKDVQALRKDVRALQRQARAAGAPADAVTQAPSPDALPKEAKKIRPTAASIKRMRKKLGVSQKDFARLLNVAPLTVYLWERKEGRLTLRAKARMALYEVRSLTRRQAAKKLADMPAA